MNAENIERARLSLDGLSVGDAFGQRFFTHPDIVGDLLARRAVPAGPWHYTDDTQMALSVVAVLENHEEVHREALARSFAMHYDTTRGYGPAMHQALARIRSGEPWSTVSQSLFGGEGSFGNGAAMRVAPLGAFFSEDLDAAASQAAKSAEVTHAHPEAIAGAIAVAVSAAWAVRLRGEDPPATPAAFIDRILPHVPPSETRDGIERASKLPAETTAHAAAEVLGNGSRVTAQDTVPFVIWSAGRGLGDFVEAMWETVSGLGDRDTTCAMVGGIVASYTGAAGIPSEWIERREPLPRWPE